MCMEIEVGFDIGLQDEFPLETTALVLPKGATPLVPGTSSYISRTSDRLLTPGTLEKRTRRIHPAVDLALRTYYTTGRTLEECAAVNNVKVSLLRSMVNSTEGEALRAQVQGDLDRHFQSLYKKVIRVLDDALEHPEPSVALAGANLWLKSNKGTKVEVTLTAEDVVKKLMETREQVG